MAGHKAAQKTSRGNENPPSPTTRGKNQDGGIDGLLHENVRNAISSLLQNDADIMKAIVAAVTEAVLSELTGNPVFVSNMVEAISLALIDWNDKMKNKTATECWNILRGELDSAIDSYVPMKKQGKRSKKKTLSKEAFRKIIYKQNMWRVYKHTGKDKDYDAYKEALNAATNEVRKSKRNVEHKLAQHIKSDSKSFYAYVRSKQNVRYRVGPLEDNAGNKITQGILMADELNMHFSSVFTREDTSSLPVPETKFEGSEGERLGQLV